MCRFKRKKQEEIDAAREKSVELAKQGAQDLLNAGQQLAQLQSQRELKRLQEKTKRGEELTKSEIKRLQRQDKRYFYNDCRQPIILGGHKKTKPRQ